MTDLKTTQEISRTPDGTEYVRLATTGANWKATLTDIFTALGGGGTGTPALPFNSIQYNNAGALGGDASLLYSGNGSITVGSAGHTASVSLKETGGNSITLQPGAATAAYTFKFPTTGGTNGYVLQTNGAGVTSWVLQTGATGSLTVGTTTITGGTDKHVVYDNAGVVGEAANFTIESGDPNVTAGNSYLYGGVSFLKAVPLLGNWFSGNSGNVTVTGSSNLADGNAAMSLVTTGNNNVAIGASALQNLLSGNANFAMGESALSVLSTASGCVAIGSQAALAYNPASNASLVAIGQLAFGANIDGGSGIAIGPSACRLNDHGSGLIGIGVQALGTATGDFNLGIGYAAGYGITTGIKNTSISGDDNFTGPITTGNQNIQIGWMAFVPSPTANGQMSIANIIYGTGNTAVGTNISTGKIGIGIKAPACELDVNGSVGVSAGDAYLYDGAQILIADVTLRNYHTGGGGNLTMTGHDNMSDGPGALGANTSGVDNCALGTNALAANTTGNSNFAFGLDACFKNAGGANNMGIGTFALFSNVNSDNNTAVGINAGDTLTGHRNTCIGYSSGRAITTGSNNIAIGAEADIQTATASDQLSIQNIIYGTGNSGTLTTVSTGKIGIGIKAPANELDLAGAFSLTTFIEGTEMSAPAAPAANGFRIFAQDNGAGKTQLMVIFNTGAAQQIAIQP